MMQISLVKETYGLYTIKMNGSTLGQVNTLGEALRFIIGRGKVALGS